jgi:hypothetical protein
MAAKIRKVRGGIGWPTIGKDGYAVLVGIKYDINDPNFEPTFHRLWEDKGRNVTELFAKCQEGTRLMEEHDLHVDFWHADITDEPMMSLWYQANLGSSSLVLTCAPYVEKNNTANFFMQEIDTFLHPTKQLFFGEGSALKGYLTAIPKDEIANIANYPPVAALAYVMAAMHQWLQLEYEKKPKTGPQKIIEHCESTGSDWDSGLFGYGGDDKEEVFE